MPRTASLLMTWPHRVGVLCSLLAVGLAAVAACSDDASTTATLDAGAGTKADANGSTCAAVTAAACGNSACGTQLGEAATCVGGQCVKVKAAGCETYGELADDNAVLLGMILPRTGDNAPYSAPIAAGAKLAVDEINAAGGIPTNITDQCAPHRKLGLVWCDDDITAGATPTSVSADFLTKTLKVPVVLGSYASGHTMPLAKGFVLPAGAMMMSPASTSPLITNPMANTDPLITYDPTDGQGTRLFWRTAVSDAAQSVACQALFQQVETQAIAAGTTTTKLALLNKLDPYGQGMIAGFEAKLQINDAAPKPYYKNDKDPAAGTNVGANFFRRDFNVALGQENPNSDGGMGLPGPDLGLLVTDLYAFRPTVIVPIGTAETLNLIGAYEKKLEDTSTPELQKPVWILVDGQRATGLFDVIALHPTLKDRIRGIVAGVPSQLASDLEVRFKSKFPDLDPRAYGVTQAYDAAYSVAYSIASLKGANVTGVAVAKGMPNLLSGPATDLSPANISAAFQSLVGGQTININGTSGPLDFDTKIGEAIADYSVWCVKAKQGGGYVFNDTTGELYSSADGVLKGTFSCQ